jgi:predicted 3-demethylubiquinone-9 3-methyltransferase (glyoxalase superfamily)
MLSREKELASSINLGGVSGRLTDKFGVSWQIIPKALGEMMADKYPRKAQCVMQAMLKMVKIDIDRLNRAYEGTE